jgi:hypothetical protein
MIDAAAILSAIPSRGDDFAKVFLFRRFEREANILENKAEIVEKILAGFRSLLTITC